MKMKSSFITIVVVLAVLLAIFLFACSTRKSEETVVGPGESEEQLITGGESFLTVKIKADFGTSDPSLLSRHVHRIEVTKMDTCPDYLLSQDSPDYEAGLDCDRDGGVIRYITPSSFKAAIKMMTFIREDGYVAEIIPDAGTLANSEIYDLASEVILFQDSIGSGNYQSVKVEFYYYEIQMEMNNPPVNQTIRVYLSDDDFPQEGNLGHHQGDITFIDSSGEEIGWISDGETWEASSLQPSRGDINGGGGTDPETGHLRGFYGSTGLWNQAKFMQGSDQDIYILDQDLGIMIENANTTITFSFNVEQTWFYEDFDGDQTFNPCANASDACAVNAAWSPLFPEIEVIIQ